VTLATPGARSQPLPWAGAAFAAFARTPIFWIGVAALVLPTFIQIAIQDWGTDQAAHAPIVLATAMWLFARDGGKARELASTPPAWLGALAILPWLLLYVAARITGLLEIRGIAIYGALIGILYALGGPRVLKSLWFPLLYCLFLIPIPDSVVDVLTQPVKLLISQAAVATLAALDYPVASSGVSIYIGQFELLIAAACAGLNSLISLTAIGIFYAYLQHRASWTYTAALAAVIFPIAVFANFIRVLTLVLVTYHFGEATAQDFLHEAAGLFMFAVALLAIFAIDAGARTLLGLRKARHA
jgi:exosortase